MVLGVFDVDLNLLTILCGDQLGLARSIRHTGVCGAIWHEHHVGAIRQGVAIQANSLVLKMVAGVEFGRTRHFRFALRRTPTPRQHLLPTLEAGRPAGAQFDVAAFDLDVAATAVEHDFVGRADDDVGAGALQVDGLLGGQGEGAALGFGAHVAAGGVQLQAGVLHGALGVFGFAPGEEADAVLHGPGLVALGQQVQISGGGEGGVAACAQHRVGGGEGGDGGRSAEQQVGALGGGDAALLGCLDALEALQRGLQALVGGQLGGLGLWGQISAVGFGVGCQGRKQLGVGAQLLLGLAAVHGLALGAGGACGAGAQRSLGLTKWP